MAATSGAGQMIQGAQDAALERGKLMLVVNTSGDRELEARASAMMLDHRVDGIVYAAMHHCVVDPGEDVRSVPAVLLDALSRAGSLPAVVPDEESGALAAMCVLLDAGHRRIGLLSGVRAVPATEGRLVGSRLALAERKLPFDPSLVVRATMRRVAATTERAHCSAATILRRRSCASATGSRWAPTRRCPS